MANQPGMFVTGATGQFGAHVVDTLLKTMPADAIVAGACSLSGEPDVVTVLRAKGVAVREADYDRPGTLATPPRGSPGARSRSAASRWAPPRSRRSGTPKPTAHFKKMQTMGGRQKGHFFLHVTAARCTQPLVDCPLHQSNPAGQFLTLGDQLTR